MSSGSILTAMWAALGWVFVGVILLGKSACSAGSGQPWTHGAVSWKGGAKERMILTAAGRLQAELAILMRSAGDGAGHRTLTQPCWGVT